MDGNPKTGGITGGSMALTQSLPSNFNKNIISSPAPENKNNPSPIAAGNTVSTPDLKSEDFIALRDYIHERSGIFFPETKMYLVKNRLANRMEQLGIKNFKDYFYMVKYDNTLKEFNALMNLITTNETSFFRNVPQLTAFSDEVLKTIWEEKNGANKKSLRIWSAGCSTGEEPYTISMLVMEKIPGWANHNIEIVANDISENVLQAARKGIYHELSLRSTPPYYRDKYFEKKGNVYYIKDIVRQPVKFSQINLFDSAKMALIKNVDIIFCRNVTIYFSDEAKKKVTKYFYNSLINGGYYFIGHAESLHGITKAFKLVYLKNGLVYKKE
jgi:chemotaxis protein methyltransferase CheR